MIKFLDYTGLTKIIDWVKSKFVQYDSTTHTLSMGVVVNQLSDLTVDNSIKIQQDLTISKTGIAKKDGKVTDVFTADGNTNSIENNVTVDSYGYLYKFSGDEIK